MFEYSTAQMIVEVLKNCGDDLSRENLIHQATNIRGLQLPMFLPGVTINISPSARIGWKKGQDRTVRRFQMALARRDRWRLNAFGAGLVTASPLHRKRGRFGDESASDFGSRGKIA